MGRFALVLFLVALLGALLGGCQDSGEGPTGTGITVTLDTPQVNLSPGGTHQFRGTVSGRAEGDIIWSVAGGPANGTITSGGLYTAPTATGVYQVIGTSAEEPAIKATAEVRVSSGVNITIAPQNVTMKVGTIQQFTANVTGTSSSAVRFTVPGSGAGGSIDSDGLYTAPNTPGTYEVRAVPLADETRVARATVTVLEGVSIRLTNPVVDPVRTLPQGKVPFNTVVTGTTNTAINWRILEGAAGGTIDANGLYTAGTTPGFYTIEGASVADPTIVVRRTVRVQETARIKVETTKGDFILNVFPTQAPNHARNIVDLTNAAFYDGIVFHRYEVDFVIQGGDPLTKTLPLDDPSIGTGGPGYTIDFEVNALKHEKYTLGMARSNDRDSAGSQWFINLKYNRSLDGDYVVFGNVDEGTSVVDQLRRGDVINRMTVIP